MKKDIVNPILPGFHPDPSIVRVGDDYYIANSSFEWFPGVPIHHSRDLIHWELVSYALTRPSQLDLRGIPDSAGVWAPSLSYADGHFWLIYTNLRQTGIGRPFKDIGIYLITARDVRGPWSEPIGLNSIGFDPSLFHDDDGRKWLVNMIWDYRKDRYRFAGIVVQEYDHLHGTLIGPMTKILAKDRILTEGPNIYKHNGWYYLMLAEGGTGWNHGISMARARNILGPYELDPQASVVTSRDDASLALQKAGHGELVQTQSGEWILAHLASRPLHGPASARTNLSTPEGMHVGDRCTLGRETCLQRVKWSEDGWLRLATNGTWPQVEIVPPPGLVPASALPPVPPDRDHFDAPKLAPVWNSLRVPTDGSWLSLTARPGWLRLYGRDSLHSLFYQSLVARRVQHFRVLAETCLEFASELYTHSAGLICYYDTRTHYYLRVSHDEKLGKILGITLTDDGAYDELAESQIAINDWKKVYLRAEIDRARLQFSASPDGENWLNIGPLLDASKLSDDYGSILHFTGAFIGLCCQDLKDHTHHADFDYFEYHIGNVK